MKRVFTALLIAVLCLYAAPAGAWSKPDYLPKEDLPEDLLFVLEASSFVQALYIDDGTWYILTEGANGYRNLHIFKTENGSRILAAEAVGLPEMNGSKPEIHAGYDSVTILYSEALLYGFEPDGDGIWRLTYVQGEQTYLCTRYWLIEGDVWQGRFLYAENSSPALSAFDPHLYPPGLDSAAQTLNIHGYALVNNPNPADRLHLRAEPSKAAGSLGKYYNGTPVHIEDELGDWVYVTVAGAEGYMMKKYLAAGLDMLNVETALAQLFIKPDLAGEALNVYTSPSSDSELAGILYDRGSGREWVFVVGVIGDDWLHVITGDGLTGYMSVSNFYPGNG